MRNYTIIIACEITNTQTIPKELVVRTIPVGTYVKFIAKENMITAIAEFWKEL